MQLRRASLAAIRVIMKPRISENRTLKWLGGPVQGRVAAALNNHRSDARLTQQQSKTTCRCQHNVLDHRSGGHDGCSCLGNEATLHAALVRMCMQLHNTRAKPESDSW